ncbi:hypothetical protein ACHAXR_004632, partial [Thalassiosira sp. AJA248-18]
MCNSAYLTGVHRAKKTLRLNTNAGTTSTDQQGYLGSVLMWLGNSGFANVISLGALEQVCRKRGGSLSYHSERDEGGFVANLGNGETIMFRRCPHTDFPYIDLDEDGGGDGVMLLQSVQDNMEGFTKKEVTRAIHARDAQAAMGYVNDDALKTEVSRKILSSSDISHNDISNAKKIFGSKSHYILRGKGKRTKPSRVEPIYASIPATIVEKCKNLTLVGDVMFVCGLPFFVSLSRGIRFVTAQYRPRRTKKLLCNALKETIRLYKRAGFIVQTCLMDNEFEPLKEMLADTVVINTTAKNKHVGEIERMIQTLKGKSRCFHSELKEIGITHIPHAVIKALIKFVVMWHNALPSKQGVSQELSPREIVLRWQLDYKKHMKARFGAYCE